MTHLGLDIGGANLKAVHADGRAWAEPMALWRDPDQLPERLGALIRKAGEVDQLRVTMTGELCDCFANRREGVTAILDAVREAAERRAIHVWSTAGRFISVKEAEANPFEVAAANWHALATCLAPRTAPDRRALLVDVGSTTTDLNPLVAGELRTAGTTDLDRLRHGELLYLGVRRTPLMAVARSIHFRAHRHHLMAEHFATTGDVFLLTGDRPELPDDADTPDGRPMTRDHAAARLLRMVGSDLEQCTIEDAIQLARAFAEVIEAKLRESIDQMITDWRLHEMITAGSGDWLIDRCARGRPITRLREESGEAASTGACAWALTKLPVEAAR